MCHLDTLVPHGAPKAWPRVLLPWPDMPPPTGKIPHPARPTIFHPVLSLMGCISLPTHGIFFFFFGLFRAAPGAYAGSRLTPQPPQRRIRATSATYTTAHGDVGSLTHWERPGMEPASSRMLVRFISTEPHWELLMEFFFFFFCLFSIFLGRSCGIWGFPG